jgi:hypothetical protein
MKHGLAAALSSAVLFASSARAQVHPQWVQTYDASPHGYDIAFCAAVAPTGAVCVGGLTGSKDLFVLTFRTGGSLAWSRTLHGSYIDAANGVLFDPSNAVYVVGRADDSAGTGGLALEYDASGSLLWSSVLHAGASTTEFGGARLRSNGNLVVHGTDSVGFLVVEYDPRGHVLWSTDIAGGDYAYDLTLGPSGEVVIVGSSDEKDESTNFGVAKLSASGALLWSHAFTGGGSGYQAGHAVLVDADGSIYAGGRIQDPATGPNAVLYKLDPSGNVLWVRTHRGTGSSGTYYAESVDSLAFAANRDVRTAGRTVDAGTETDVHIAEFTPDGMLAWQQDWNGPGNADDVVTALATGDDGSLTALAVTEEASGKYAPVVLRWGPHGEFRWADVEPVSPTEHAFTGVCAIGAEGLEVFAGTTMPDRQGATNVVIVSERDQAQPFCFGYDGGAPCPCGNSPAPGEGQGCVNSTGDAARMTDAGHAVLSADTLKLTVTGTIGSTPVIFLQGDAVSAPEPFGDGLRCVGHGAMRLFVYAASGGVAVAPSAGDPSISARSAALGDPIPSGGVRLYQAIYRDSSAIFCPPPAGGSTNASSALSVEWAE